MTIYRTAVIKRVESENFQFYSVSVKHVLSNLRRHINICTFLIKNSIRIYRTIKIIKSKAKKARFKLPRELYLTGLCKGNGKSLVFADGLREYGVTSLKSQSNTAIGITTGAVGINSGGIVNAGTWAGWNDNYYAYGIITDGSKSGIIVERNSSKYLFFFIN